jgi:hypothetical protein
LANEKKNGDGTMNEYEKESDSRDRLMEFYIKLISGRGVALQESRYKALKSLVNNLTEDAVDKKLSRLEEQRVNRLMAYVSALNKLTKEEEQTADALLEVIEATAEDPEQESATINGNNFLFEKGTLDIGKYVDKLSAIGNEQKGNTWSVYVDDEGELVIY